MKSNTELSKEKKLSVVRVDPSLNKYSNVILFPEKMEKLKESIKKFGLPKPEDFSR